MTLIFRTEAGLIFNLTGANRTAGFYDDSRAIDLDQIQRSFGPGSIVIGEKRLQSAALSIVVEINRDADTDFRTEYNQLIYWAREARWIEDTDSDLRTRVSFSGVKNTMDRGGMLRGNAVTLEFVQETPYWEDVDYITIVDENSAAFSKALNNLGWLPSPPRIELTAAGLTPFFQFYVGETREGIEIQDLQFGLTGLQDFIIDCETGETFLGTIPRNDRITGNSGFFDLPVGAYTLNFQASAALDVVVKYRRRWYL